MTLKGKMKVKWGAVYGAALADMGLCGLTLAANGIAQSRFDAGFLPDTAIRSIGVMALVGIAVWAFSLIKMNKGKKGV